MTRGIHLKQLTATDLGLLGLPEALLGEGQTEDPIPIETGAERPAAPAAELALELDLGSVPDLAGDLPTELASAADPFLSLLTQEVRLTLEETLVLLDQALAVSQELRSG
jgi:hypothetical protein